MSTTWASQAQALASVVVVLTLIVATLACAVVMLVRELSCREAAPEHPPLAAVVRAGRMIAASRASRIDRAIMRGALAVSGALLAALLWGWARAAGVV